MIKSCVDTQTGAARKYEKHIFTSQGVETIASSLVLTQRRTAQRNKLGLCSRVARQSCTNTPQPSAKLS